uniref:Ligninase LG5 n=1 Tax=Phanerodontia chrysosporium TaxID=2822231 RepID=LIG5_PHACH|nr:RecName: Full=Ligninase LG5; AltName: Full=Diarylpropane peroxidase; AltName: Full=Lignin peroxidase; Flags: Precursor [Phanerodontia chrysosporium]AAA33734.1 ligninase precursor [Phanerodontia chrysosporium]AAA33739.1 lignin peroxidase precursor [Phanerodontia chrysosporium]CAA39033.1 lignin peroxidase [Phanerodontia chrysosporium]
MAFKKLLAVLTAALSLRAAQGAAVEKRATCSNGKVVPAASCCTWFNVLSDIQENLFNGGQCGAEAHESIRLVFHDAIAISPAMEPQASSVRGADGSIMIFDEIETNFHPNIGLDEIVRLQKPFVQKHGVTPGDFIAFAGAVALSNCPGAPQMNFFTGRAPATQPAPDGLVPEPFHSVDQIIDRVFDAGEFDELELVWMLSAHSVAAANDIDPNIQGLPFDSTPGIFDSQFFVETQLAGTGFTGGSNNQGEVSSPLPGEMRLQSDFLIARDARTACEWQSFVNNQSKLVSDFQFIFLALTQLGQDPDAMTDCSAVIPISKPAPNNTPGFSFFPPGMTMDDVEQACAETPFPTLSTLPGPATSVARIPPPPGA